jgi:nicotinamidase-related amidase
LVDTLLLVDVIPDFEHEDGAELLASYRERHLALLAAITDARTALIAAVQPLPGEPFLFKPGYSAFDHTALELILTDLGAERLLLAGTATEMCVVQTAIDAREHGLKVTILADACASADLRAERIALEYAERVVGARVTHQRASAMEPRLRTLRDPARWSGAAE